MYRMMGILVLFFWPVLLVGAERTSDTATVATLIPDPDYQPKVGDRAVLYSLDTEKIPFDIWCAATSPDCRNYIKSLFAGEEDEDGNADKDKEYEGTDVPAAEAKLVHLAPKTDVQLISSETVEVEGTMEGTPLKCTYFAVHVLSGPFQGRTLYTLDFQITRLIAAPAGSLGTAAEAGAEAKAPGTSAAVAAPIRLELELETPDIAVANQEAAKPPEAPIAAPVPTTDPTPDSGATRIELESPDVHVPAKPHRETQDASAVALASVPDASAPAELADLEPAAAEALAPRSVPLTPLPEPKFESRELGHEPSAHTPPAISSPKTQRTGNLPQAAPRTVPVQARALVSAPAKPPSARVLLAMAQEREGAGKALEALVAYRTLERTHPGSPETRIAVGRIKGLTERMELDTQEVRAARVMEQARDLEASGHRTLALGYFQQIVRVYPKTTTARLATEKIKTMGANRPSPAR